MIILASPIIIPETTLHYTTLLFNLIVFVQTVCLHLFCVFIYFHRSLVMNEEYSVWCFLFHVITLCWFFDIASVKRNNRFFKYWHLDMWEDLYLHRYKKIPGHIQVNEHIPMVAIFSPKHTVFCMDGEKRPFLCYMVYLQNAVEHTVSTDKTVVSWHCLAVQ